MTYDEFRRQLGKAGLTVKDFAGLIKQSPNSISNHSKHGEVPSHLAIIATLMGEMADFNVDFRSALSRIKFEAHKPRGGISKSGFSGVKKIDEGLNDGNIKR